MTLVGWAQIALVLALVLACAIPLSKFIADVYAGERTFLSPVIGPVERGFYRLAGVDPAREQNWFAYTIAMVVFSVAGFLSLYVLQRLQNFLPLNPRGFDAVAPDLAFNTSVSFITNTNWQNYSGETTMSHLTQMLGLTVHNFLSAATGLAMAFALVRSFARSSATTVGNFWVDVTRVTLYILLPISVVGALVFVALGMPQTLVGAVDATTLEGAKQTISIGPVASQEIIKELGTNGGGFFNANAAHPFENPNGWSNLLEIWALLLIPVASVLAFGRAVGDMRQGRAILAAMAVFFIVGVGVAYWSETAGNPILTAQGVDPSAGNLEGKEIRNGQAMSVLFATATSGTSTGSVNTMHDSMTPLGGMVPMFNLLAGCIWPGGVGAGLYGFLVLAIIAVFVAGLMVGRTPEYLGKKIETREMKLAMLAVLIYPLSVLGFTGASVLLADRAQQYEQQRAARPVRGDLRLCVGQRQQRLRLRRPERQHALVQHDARPRDAARPLRLCHSRFGLGRIAGREEEDSGFGRHLPDRRAAVCRPLGRRHRDSLPAAIFPGAVARRRSSSTS